MGKFLLSILALIFVGMGAFGVINPLIDSAAHMLQEAAKDARVNRPYWILAV